MIPKIIIGLIVCVCVRSLFDHKCIKSTHSAMMRSSKGTYLENKKNQLVVIVDIYIYFHFQNIYHPFKSIDYIEESEPAKKEM